jgi:hypothetical protein
MILDMFSNKSHPSPSLKLFATFLLACVTGCTTPPVKTKVKHKELPRPAEPVTGEAVLPPPQAAAPVVPAPLLAAPAVVPAASAPAPVTPPPPVVAPSSSEPDPCETTTKFVDGEPIFLPENKVMMTRIMSPCMNRQGVAGHKADAGWMAMGFPCTGGEGRIDWKGTNYARPKMVSFLLETSCAMAPSDTSKIRAEAVKITGLSPTAPMIAFNPFVIQYWEVPGYDDADTSFIVDLRSGKGIDEAWVRFIKPKPLRIFLVGRENAWVPGNYMYAVEGDLTWTSKNRFSFSVVSARLLKGDELNLVRTRCEQLKPGRDCVRVF